jgi:hypothetical protein
MPDRIVRWHGDNGDAWLEVPLSDVSTLGLGSQISERSRMTATHAYLQEDDDADAFLGRAAAEKWRVRQLPEVVFSSEGDSPVRGLAQFNPYWADHEITLDSLCELQDGRDARVIDVVNSKQGPKALIETLDGVDLYAVPFALAPLYLKPPKPELELEMRDAAGYRM